MTKEIESFSAIARRYCHLVETAHHLPLEQRLTSFTEALVELYLRALSLPEVEPTERDVPGERQQLLEWPGFAQFEGYWELFDPYELDEPVAASLTDDLLDIYHDLLPGLGLINAGRPEDIADAVWAWRFTFSIHWGNHLVDALRALHWAISHSPSR